MFRGTRLVLLSGIFSRDEVVSGVGQEKGKHAFQLRGLGTMLIFARMLFFDQTAYRWRRRQRTGIIDCLFTAPMPLSGNTHTRPG